MKDKDSTSQGGTRAAAQKQPYRTPRIQSFGKVAYLTQGSMNGMADGQGNKGRG